MFVAWAPLLWLVNAAQGEPLRLDPAAPPVQVEGRTWRFGGHLLEVAPAVVVQAAAGWAPPPGARWLGGPFWRITSASPVADALALLDAPGVVEVFPDVVVPKTRRDFDDPSYPGQWYLQDLGMAELYAVSEGSPDVRVAVLDSGIDLTHPDLAGKVLAPYDAWDDDDDPSPNPGEFCGGGDAVCDEHGTAVSGIVLAEGGNGEGIVGMCPACTLVPIKLLGEGRGASSADIAAFEHAIAQDVAVLNNSWGYTEPTAVPVTLANAIARAATEGRGGKGALVVFAAGNDDRELGAEEIEALPDVFCVSGTDSYGYPVNYTNYGDPIDVAAPSATVSIAPGGEVTTTFGGTSAAAPVVAGLAGWAASVAPELTGAELGELLIATATPSPYVPETDHDDYYGYGNLSAAGLLAALAPEEEVEEGEEPRACGCAATRAWPAVAPASPKAASPWSALLWSTPLLSTLLLRRRR